jgi:hypothetical protein
MRQAEIKRTTKQSEYVKKKHALKSLRRREEVAELVKMGKMSETPTRGRR